MATLTEQELRDKLRDVEEAIAQQRLEGLDVPECTIEDLKRIALGELSAEEAIANGHRRIKDGSLLSR